MNDDKIEICSIDANTVKPIRSYHNNYNINNIQDGCYSTVVDKIVFTTYYGAIIQINNKGEETVINQDKLFPYSCTAIADDGSIFVHNSSTKDLYCIKDNRYKLIADDIDPYSIQFEHNRLVVCDAESDSILVFNIEDLSKAFMTNTIATPNKTVNNIRYNNSLIINIILTWISYIYLFVVLIILVVRLLKKAELSEKLKMYFATSILLVITIIGISVFFTSNIYIRAETSMNGSLKTASLTAKDLNKENFEAVKQKNIDIKTQINYYEDIYKNFGKTVNNFAQGNKALDIDYVDVSETKGLLNDDICDNESGYTKTTLSILESLNVSNLKDTIITKIDLDQGTTLAAIQPITSINNELQGLIITTYPTNQLQIEQISNTIGYAIILIIAIAAILLIGLEVLSFKKALSKSIKIKANKIKGQIEISGSRIFSFLYHLIYCIDVALLVLIAKDILKVDGIDNAILALSFPASLYALGAFIGTTIAKKIIEKIYARNIFVGISSILFFARLLLCFPLFIVIL